MDSLAKQMILKNVVSADTSILNKEDEKYLKRLIYTRNYLVHSSLMTTPLMRLGGSITPLQETNTKEDIEDAFRITVALEPRLISTLRHIEATLFDCVCVAY